MTYEELAKFILEKMPEANRLDEVHCRLESKHDYCTFEGKLFEFESSKTFCAEDGWKLSEVAVLKFEMD